MTRAHRLRLAALGLWFLPTYALLGTGYLHAPALAVFLLSTFTVSVVQTFAATVGCLGAVLVALRLPSANTAP